MKNSILLTCTGIRYYSRKDENAFFEWIKKIDCIENVNSAGKNLYLQIPTHDLHDHDLRELLAIFYRYKIDMKQLQIFLNKNNQEWFQNNKKAYRHKRVFGI